MCMQFSLRKFKIFLFTTTLLLLIIPRTKAINSARPGARQSATDSVMHVDQIRTLYKSKRLFFKALYASF